MALLPCTGFPSGQRSLTPLPIRCCNSPLAHLYLICTIFCCSFSGRNILKLRHLFLLFFYGFNSSSKGTVFSIMQKLWMVSSVTTKVSPFFSNLNESCQLLRGIGFLGLIARSSKSTHYVKSVFSPALVRLETWLLNSPPHPLPLPLSLPPYHVFYLLLPRFKREIISLV